MLLGRSGEDSAGGAVGATDKAGSGSGTGAGPDSAAGATGKAGSGPEAAGQKPSFREFGYDRKGRLVLILERAERGGPALSSLRRGFDEEGWLKEVEFRENEALSARLELGYEGSGRAGYALLRSAAGELLEAASFELGGGAAEGSLLSLELAGPGGEPLTRLRLNYDAAGRLSGYERQGAGSGPGASGGSSLGIIELLPPLWPGEAPSFELARLLALGPALAPIGSGSPFASGFSGLPFGAPGEGRAEFLYDQGGRILEARLYGESPPAPEPAGSPLGPIPPAELSPAPLAKVEYRYDEAGFLVEELRLSAEGALVLLHVYRLEKSGAWIERSSFVRGADSALALLEPLEYRERRLR